MAELIFVGGVHGSGKTSLVSLACEKYGFTNVSASAIIRESMKGRINWDADKRVDDVSYNQSILISRINEVLHRVEKVVLDGHFVLKGKENTLKRIDIKVFSEIKPNGLVVVIGDPMKIRARLVNRDATFLSLQDIEIFQETELVYAKYVAQKLGLHLEIVDNDRGLNPVSQFDKYLSRYAS